MSEHKEITIQCPRPDCEGIVDARLDWEPADPHYGADADGNRGMYVRGYWTADTGPSCSEGHVFFADERVALDERSAAEVNDEEPEDNYDGPDEDDYYDR